MRYLHHIVSEYLSRERQNTRRLKPKGTLKAPRIALLATESPSLAPSLVTRPKKLPVSPFRIRMLSYSLLMGIPSGNVQNAKGEAQQEINKP